ncbi:MAG: flagellar export chaperone FlgN [Gemmatimonadales bacterium]
MSQELFTDLSSGPERAARADGLELELAEALRTETRLLEELTSIMRGQRDAVAKDDPELLDDSVFSTHRVLVTLAEARRRRRSLNHLFGRGDDLTVAAIESLFAGPAPVFVRNAADRLADAARRLQREVEMNRRILRVAIESGDQFVRALTGVSATRAAGYAPTTGTSDVATGGVLVDRRI